MYWPNLAIYNVLRQPASWMPRVIAQIVESRVSLKRMQDYLQAEELNDHSITRIKSHDNFAAENVIEVHSKYSEIFFLAKTNSLK